ncbi:MAG TPA: GTPase Era [Gemmatimonadaceae bacterium]|nr:GTPase Era [Gemmatimonadaceae bacterium]
MTKAGIVTVAGRPNAGKSTLLNRLVGQRLAITSPKPQSTRERVVGLITDADSQIILLDTPGLLEPAYALQSSMRDASRKALRDADVIVHLIDALEGVVETLTAAAGFLGGAVPRAPVILAFNKSDALTDGRRSALLSENPGAVVLSALRGDGVDGLLARIRELLPEHPFYYDADDLSTQNMRFFASEMVRETALEQLDDEVPYSVACAIEEFREDRAPVYIRATLYIERESQKRILIGAGGSRIKAIGTRSRAKIEALLGSPVYLDLRVKVLPNWRRDAVALRRLGYSIDP